MAIPITKRKARLILAGLLSTGELGAGVLKTLVGGWYNDIFVPKLPKGTKQIYPYAVVKLATWSDSEEISTLACLASSRLRLEFGKNSNGEGLEFLVSDEEGTFELYSIREDGRWGSYLSGGSFVAGEQIFGTTSKTEGGTYSYWANFDFYDTDGNLVVPASDPIFVYE